MGMTKIAATTSEVTKALRADNARTRDSFSLWEVSLARKGLQTQSEGAGLRLTEANGRW